MELCQCPDHGGHSTTVGWSVKDANHAFNEVVYVGKASAVVAVVVNLDDLALGDSLSKLMQGHVRTMPWAVHLEET